MFFSLLNFKPTDFAFKMAGIDLYQSIPANNQVSLADIDLFKSKAANHQQLFIDEKRAAGKEKMPEMRSNGRPKRTFATQTQSEAQRKDDSRREST